MVLVPLVSSFLSAFMSPVEKVDSAVLQPITHYSHPIKLDELVVTSNTLALK
jgi:hypothetical protein